jgi:hypothetical protein
VEGIIKQLDSRDSVTAADLSAMLSASRRQQSVSVGVTHWLSQLFSHDSIPVNTALTFGMAGFNAAAPLKRKFMSVMTGRSGRVPSLLMRQPEQ